MPPAVLLMTAAMDEVVVKAVGSHHSQAGLPSALSCLIHLADNLAKDFGLNRGGLDRLRKTLDGTTVAEIMAVVDRCTAS